MINFVEMYHNSVVVISLKVFEQLKDVIIANCLKKIN